MNLNAQFVPSSDIGRVLLDVDIDERRDRRVKNCLTVFLGGCLAFVVIDSFTNQWIEGVLVGFIDWVKDNPSVGVVAVVLVYVLATVLFVPGSILTLGTGYAFGSAFHSTAIGVGLASLVSGDFAIKWYARELEYCSLAFGCVSSGSFYWCHLGQHVSILVG